MSALGWKVPFRHVYCDTLLEWLRATIWCHVVRRLYPYATEACPHNRLQHCERCDAALLRGEPA